MKIVSGWPQGSKFQREKLYRGLAIAEIEVDVNNLYITNDLPRTARPDSLKCHCAPLHHVKFVKLLESGRLELLAANAGNPASEIYLGKKNLGGKAALERMQHCMKIKKSTVSVIQKIDGRVIVVDGTHRLLAIFFRDGNLQNLRFLITL